MKVFNSTPIQIQFFLSFFPSFFIPRLVVSLKRSSWSNDDDATWRFGSFVLGS